MHPEKSFDPLELITNFNKSGLRYVLIGRHAVIQYGAPLFSFDYDFWIHREDREKSYKIIKDFGLIPNHEISRKRPIVNFTDDEGNKVDVFFFKSVTNRDGITLTFDLVYQNSVIKKDPEGEFYLRIPCIEDLIQLKKMGNRTKDIEDIEYLEALMKTRRKR